MIAQITYAIYMIYQGLSKRRKCKEFGRRKANNAPGVNLRQSSAFVRKPSFFAPANRANRATRLTKLPGEG